MLWFQGLEAPTQQVQHNRKHRFTWYNPRHASYICNCDSKPSCWYTKQWCVNKACIVHNVHVDLHPLCLYHTETYPCTYCTQKAATWQASGVILGGHILMRIPVHTCGKTQENVVITWPRSIPYSRKTHSHMFVISQPTYYLLLFFISAHVIIKSTCSCCLDVCTWFIYVKWLVFSDVLKNISVYHKSHD